MTSLNFFRGATVGLLISIMASATYFLATFFFSEGLALRATISAAALVYISYLLHRSGAAFGKVSIISLYLLSVLALLYLWPSIVVYALFHVGFIWLVRTIYFQDNFLYAFADLVFSVMSFAATLVAIFHSHSVFMSFWCFFLGQALILPVLHYFFQKYTSSKYDRHAMHHQGERNTANAHQLFHQAHRSAQEALTKLANNPKFKS